MAAKRSTKLDNRDPKTEAILESHGIEFEFFDAVPIEEVKRHKASQSRLKAVDKARVIQYADAMKAGSAFPPVVLSKDGFDGFRIIDGEGRTSAAERCKRATVAAYVVELSGEQESVYLSAVFNAQNGQPLTKAERVRAVRSALAMVPNPPTIEQIAKDYGVTSGAITIIRDGDATRVRLSNLGVSSVDRLSQSHLRTLGRINDDAVLVQTALLVLDANLSITETGDLVKRINAPTVTSEAERLKLVADERADRAEAIKALEAGRMPMGSPVSDSRMVLGRLISLSTNYPDPALWVPRSRDQLDAWGPKIHEALRFLTALAAAYDGAVVAVEGDEGDGSAVA